MSPGTPIVDSENLRVTLYDAYARPFKSLRMAVTYACNFNCFFCHREGIDKLYEEELTWEELSLISRVARKLGAEDIKITGGEPLLKRGISNLIRDLSEYGFRDVSLSTNGYFLKDKIGELVNTGLKRINVSLHTLNRERFKLITGVDALDRVLEGLLETRDFGIKVFINFTILKGINEDEILDVIEFALAHGFNVHLIELHPVGRAKENFEMHHSFPREVLEYLESRSSKIEIRPLHYRLRYIIGGSLVELVQPVSNPLFCAGCTRIRVSPDGKLYPCLNSFSEHVNVKEILRNSELNEEMKEYLIEEAFLKVNEQRRPYNLWNLDYEKNVFSKYSDKVEALRKHVSRIQLPKRYTTKNHRNIKRVHLKLLNPNS